jgi:hypothetical protein
MSLLDKLERVLGRFAVPNISLYLIIGQVFVLLAAMLDRLDIDMIRYAPVLVTQGEWWRVFTFMFVPPPISGKPMSLVFLCFGWYLFYLMGNALEGQWGTFRFNAFLFMSYALTLAFAFVVPLTYWTNSFILGSVFIAFAYLYPDFELVLFFILPVKVKWLALLSVALGAYQLVVGNIVTRLQIAAPVITFLVFFGADIVRTIRQGRRTAVRRAERAVEEAQPRHVCFVCGKNDKTHPQLDFRYCSKCAGDQCYCPEHIQNHAHVVAPDGPKAG